MIFASQNWYQRGLIITSVVVFGVAYAVTGKSDFGFLEVLFDTGVAMVIYNIGYGIYRLSTSGKRVPAPVPVLAIEPVEFSTTRYVRLVNRWLYLLTAVGSVVCISKMSLVSRGDAWVAPAIGAGFVLFVLTVYTALRRAQSHWDAWPAIWRTKRRFHYAMQLLAVVVSVVTVVVVEGLPYFTLLFYPIFVGSALCIVEGIFLPLTLVRLFDQLNKE